MAQYAEVKRLNNTCMAPGCDRTGVVMVESFDRIVGMMCSPHVDQGLASGEAKELRGSAGEWPTLVLGFPSGGGTTFGV